mmetsp:Transcript_21582/g.32116  ORF Transcript_21582/g.32116 Transcript_21582/m.32116 type:complete len:1291 (+) Transcript_21582:95-3967(+)
MHGASSIILLAAFVFSSVHVGRLENRFQFRARLPARMLNPRFRAGEHHAQAGSAYRQNPCKSRIPRSKSKPRARIGHPARGAAVGTGSLLARSSSKYNVSRKNVPANYHVRGASIEDTLRAAVQSKDFDLQDVLRLLRSVSHLINPRTRSFGSTYRFVTSRIVQRIEEYSPHEVVSILSTLSKINVDSETVGDRLLSRVKTLKQSFTASQARTCLSALAKLQIRGTDDLAHELAVMSMQDDPKTSSEHSQISGDTARTIWSLAKLTANPTAETINPLCDRIIQTGDSMDPLTSSMVMWSLGRFHASFSQIHQDTENTANATALANPRLMDTIKAAVDRHAQLYSPHSVANVIWAYAKLSTNVPVPTIKSLISQACARRSQLNPQGLSNILWGLAKLSYTPESKDVEWLVRESMSASTKLVPQGLSNILWAWARLSNSSSFCESSNLLPRLERRFHTIAPSCNSQEIANSIWAFATMMYQPSLATWKAVESWAERAPTNAVNPQELSNLLWSIAKLYQSFNSSSYSLQNTEDKGGFQSNKNSVRSLKIKIERVVSLLSSNVQYVSETLSPLELLNTLWAFAKVSKSIDPTATTSLIKRATLIAPDATPKDIAGTLWALGRILGDRFNPSSSVPMEENCKQKYYSESAECSICHKLSPEASRLVSLLHDQAVGEMHKFNTQDLSNTLWGFARLQVRPSAELVEHLQWRAQSISEEFQPPEVAGMFWGFATLGITPTPETSFAMFNQLSKCIHHFDAQGLVNTLWACARLQQLPDNSIWEKIKNQLSMHTSRLTEQGIANALWALAKTEDKDSKSVLISKLTNQALNIAPEFTPQGMASVTWSMARLSCASHLIEAFLLSAQPKIDLTNLTAQGVSNILWALAHVRSRHSHIVQKVANTLDQKVESLNAQEVTIVIWALARLRYKPAANVLERLENRAKAIVPSCTTQASTVLLWGFARLSHIPKSEFLSSYQSYCEKQASRYNVQGITNTLWAFGTLSQEPSAALGSALLQNAISKLDEFKGRSLARLYLSLARLESIPDNSTANAMNRQIMKRAREQTLSSNDIAAVIWAMSRSPLLAPGNLYSRSELLEKLENALVQAPQQLSLRALPNLLWAFSTLERGGGAESNSSIAISKIIDGCLHHSLSEGHIGDELLNSGSEYTNTESLLRIRTALGLQGVISILISMAKMQLFVSRRSWHSLERLLEANMPLLTCEQASDALWALSRLPLHSSYDVGSCVSAKTVKLLRERVLELLCEAPEGNEEPVAGRPEEIVIDDNDEQSEGSGISSIVD